MNEFKKIPLNKYISILSNNESNVGVYNDVEVINKSPNSIYGRFRRTFEIDEIYFQISESFEIIKKGEVKTLKRGMPFKREVIFERSVPNTIFGRPAAQEFLALLPSAYIDYNIEDIEGVIGEQA